MAAALGLRARLRAAGRAGVVWAARSDVSTVAVTLAIAFVVGLLVALAERRRARRSPVRPRRRHTAEVLYTRGGEPRWGAVGAWDRGGHRRGARRRLKEMERGRVGRRDGGNKR